MESVRLRALVVDDEVAIRKLIAGALRKQQFDCDEAADGQDAARLAAATRYDAVVTDLKMPNMNGHVFCLQVLNQEHRPLIVVHTGVIDPRLAHDLLMRGVDDIVYKPADVSLLAAKICAMVERRHHPQRQTTPGSSRRGHREMQAAAADESASSSINLSRLNARLADVSSVLPVSNAALDVYEMTRNEHWKISQIAAAIQRDASLVAEVLRLANGSLYNPSGRRIISLDEAVVRMGQKRVGELALAANALSAVAPSLLPWMDLELAWKRSMAAGIALEYLIELGGHQAIEEGLLLGAIMYPLGRVALAMLFPEHYEAMIENCRRSLEPLREQERRTFPTSHTEVMAHLLANWRIPADVCLPLKFSMDDFSALARLSEPTRTRTELVKVAVILGRLAESRWEDWDLVQVPSSRLLKRLRVANVVSILQKIRLDLKMLANFHPDAAPASDEAPPPSPNQTIAYCDPSSNDNDMLAALLDSLGIECTARTITELQDSEEASIVNCLGVASAEFAAGGDWPRSLFVADHDTCEVFERLARTAALPDSYARFHHTLSNFLTEHQPLPVGAAAGA
jgi:HD-like signal output (HDOD) protein/ActR/RegA family two-component response regulator